jgi:hypothetical protein
VSYVVGHVLGGLGFRPRLLEETKVAGPVNEAKLPGPIGDAIVVGEAARRSAPVRHLRQDEPFLQFLRPVFSLFASIRAWPAHLVFVFHLVHHIKPKLVSLWLTVDPYGIEPGHVWCAPENL